VAGGGALWATYALGTVNETDLCHLGGIPGGALKDVFGIVAEEVDTLYPEERAAASFDGEKHELADYCEMLRLRGARVLGQYESDWYAGAPAVTEHRYGQGRAVYQAARDTGSLGQAILEYLIRELGLRANVPGELPKGVTAHSRTDGEKTYLFVENYYGEEAPEIELGRKCTDLLTGETVDRVKLPGYGFGVYQIDS